MQSICSIYYYVVIEASHDLTKETVNRYSLILLDLFTLHMSFPHSPKSQDLDVWAKSNGKGENLLPLKLKF